MTIYSLVIGLLLIILGGLMRMRKGDFLLSRYESFHKIIRKKQFTLDREGLSRFYTVFYWIEGTLFIIIALLEFIEAFTSESSSIWAYGFAIAFGILGILYCNITTKFLNFED
ncbi:MAG: DUF3784 domain-containing protein [Promethearchaeota archaeon]